MGCGTSLWLLISCYWVWGVGCGMMETVLGTLGKATVLGIPPEFQKLTQHSGTATWKRSMGNPLNKEILFTYYNGNYTNFKPGQNLFHPSNFSLEILSTQRQDQQLYEYSVTMKSEERNWHIQLEVYEPVSDPSIHILGWTLANDSCTVTLNCTAAQGDNVSYSWASSEASTSAPCTHNGSLLQLSYNLTNSILPCVCIASNPVSRRTAAFYPSICSAEHWATGSSRTGMLLLAVMLPIVILTMFAGAFVAAHVAANMRKSRENSSLTEDSTVHTIYSQVQRVEKQKSPSSPVGTDHPTCTTIYAAATGTVPHSPQSPDLEPMTVYASVTLPIS